MCANKFLSVNDRVICEMPPSNERCEAVIVALDSEYQAAANAASKEASLVHVQENSLRNNYIPKGRIYVHFIDRDRRLDRWVEASEIFPLENSSPQEKVGSTPDPSSPVKQNSGRSSEPKLTRSRRRALEELNPVSEKEVGNEIVAKIERAREERTKVRNIAQIVLGDYEIDAWYFSPFPGKYGSVDRLYFCQYCLKYVRTNVCYQKHQQNCTWISPPGSRIYHEPAQKVAVYEIDGLVNVAYCQRLCLLGKLFLDHKTLCFDVPPFLFYVITISGELAGFFSKEKWVRRSEFNLACILTLPQHQRKGIGRFLISFSYELTKRDGLTGSPERPLSDLGQLSYRSYWMHAIYTYALSRRGDVGITTSEVAKATGIRCADISSTLKSMNMLNIWKGENYMDTNSKSLESVAGRISHPRLPLNPCLLNYPQEDKLDIKAKLTSPRSPLANSIRRKPLRPLERIVSRFSQTKPQASASSPLRVSPVISDIQKHSSRASPFNGTEKLINELFKNQAPERVLTALGSALGAPSSEPHKVPKKHEQSVDVGHSKIQQSAAEGFHSRHDLKCSSTPSPLKIREGSKEQRVIPEYSPKKPQKVSFGAPTENISAKRCTLKTEECNQFTESKWDSDSRHTLRMRGDPTNSVSHHVRNGFEPKTKKRPAMHHFESFLAGPIPIDLTDPATDTQPMSVALGEFRSNPGLVSREAAGYSSRPFQSQESRCSRSRLNVYSNERATIMASGRAGTTPSRDVDRNDMHKRFRTGTRYYSGPTTKPIPVIDLEDDDQIVDLVDI